MKRAWSIIAIGVLANLNLRADEAAHGELDAFMAEAASLLPVHSVIAPGAVANAQIQQPADRAIYGEWGPLLAWPFIPVTAANLPDGRIVTFASNERTNFPVGPEFTYAGVWDPATGQHTEINNDNHDMFCAAVSMSASGQPMFSGGRNSVRFSTKFDFENDSWLRIEDMNDGRWYASSNTMPNGSTIVASGNKGTGTNTVERFTPGSGWTRLLGAPWNGVGTTAFPYNFVAPDGRILYTGPGFAMKWIDTEGRGNVTPTSASFPGTRVNQSGGVAMYDEGKVIFAGGGGVGGATTNIAHTVDFNSAQPVVTEIASMTFPRRYHNALVLPDGDVIVVGGNTSGVEFSDAGTIYAPELWNPTSDTWSELADMSKPRNYHSVALLLPDGRVFSGGGGLSSNPITNHQDAQIFSPPYLFKPDGTPAIRPSITSAPRTSSPGSTVRVVTSPTVQRFTMVRMTATTHAFSSDTRFLNVPHTIASSGQFDLNLHANGNVLLPGAWMLFAIDAAGTPSEAKVIKIVSPTPPRITNPGDQHSVVGYATNFNILAEDGDGDTLTYSATGLPTGTVIDSITGKISGNPQAAGNHTVTISVTDGQTSVSASFDWEVSLSPGLISHWPFDEGGGSFTYDMGGADSDGTLVNGTEWEDGVHGGAIAVNGVDEHIVFPNRPALELGKNGSDFSVSFWMRLGQDTTEVDRAIIRKGNSDEDNTFGIWLAKHSAKLKFGVSTTSHPLCFSISVNELPFEEWAHVALVKNADNLTLYLDGEADKALALAGQTVSNNGPIYLGDSPWELGTNSYIDDLAIYDRALSVSEVTFISQPSNNVIGVNSPPIVNSPGNRVSPTIPVSLQIDATDPNGNTLTFSHDSQLPPGLTLDPTTGQITGTPTTVGFYQPKIHVSDGIETTTITFDWQIAPHFIANATIHGPIQTGVSKTYTITTDGTGLSYEWDFGDGTPIISTTSNTVTHSFTQPGRYTIGINITDTYGQQVQLSHFQAVHAPPTATSPKVSQSVILTTDKLWNANPDNNSVSVFDPTSGVKLAEIPVGKEPRSLAAAPTGNIWVTNKDDATVSVIDPGSLTVTSTINLPHASKPHGILFSPTAAYIALEASGQLVKLNPTTGTTLATAQVGEHPRHISLNHNATKAFVSRFITPPVTGESTADPMPAPTEGGEIVVVNTATMQPTNTIILQNSTSPDTSTSARGIPNYLGPAAISPDGTTAWVASKQDNIQRGVGRDGKALTHDTTVRSITSRIDLSTETENQSLRIDHDNGSVASTSIFDRYGNFVFSALEGSREIAITDVYNGIEIKRFNVGRAPQGLALSPNGRTLYVHNFMDRTVTSHDLSQIIDGTGEAVPTLATFDSVATEKLAPRILLGKQLFYDVQDIRLGLESYISCASCHNDEAQDGRVWDLTGFGEGLRNTIDLRGRAGTAHGRLHWSANFDEVQDFEGQIRGLAGGAGLLSNGAPHAPLGAPNTGRSSDLDALAEYVASLSEFDASRLRQLNGALSPNAAAGKRIFTNAGCADCHGGTTFSDSITLNLHDIGTLKPTSGKRLNGTLPGIDTPTLRSLAGAAPYLHDGSAPTLADAVAAHPSAAPLTQAEIAQLVDYLLEIDGTEPAPITDSAIPDSNTIALYHFDGDFTDSGPAARTLTTSGNTALTTSSPEWMHQPSGNAVRFTAIGDTISVTIPDADIQPDTGAPFSLEARVLPRAYLGYSIDDIPLISLYQEWDANFELEDKKWGTNPRGPEFRSSATMLATAQQWADAATPGTWHHLKISYDGINTVSLWIDNILLSSTAISPNPSRTNDWTLTIGNFDGDLDELIISRSPSTPPTAAQTGLAVAVANHNQTYNTNLTLPLRGDSDGDGIHDLLELAHGSNASGHGIPDIITTQRTSGANLFTTYSFPVPLAGNTLADGYQTDAFTYTVEATADFKIWTRPILATSNPTDLPQPPTGHRYITFRHLSPAEGTIFFRTRVLENQ